MPEIPRCHYAVLGLRPEADTADIRAAYDRLIVRWHPDRCRESDALEWTTRINLAFQTLRDPGRRARYDALRRAESPRPQAAARERPRDPWDAYHSPWMRARSRGDAAARARATRADAAARARAAAREAALRAEAAEARRRRAFAAAGSVASATAVFGLLDRIEAEFAAGVPWVDLLRLAAVTAAQVWVWCESRGWTAPRGWHVATALGLWIIA
jgi:curved DNA-binding protein CbpA